MNIALIFAGGSGIRMGAGVPKQFLEVNGKPILVHTVQLFQYHKKIDKIYIATIEDYIPYVEDLIEEYRLSMVTSVIKGGDSAMDSIYRLIRKAAEENDGDSIVLVHDGVRPFVDYDVISDNIDSVLNRGNAITCTLSTETVIISNDGNTIDSVPLRKNSYTAQAPQSFRLSEILAAHDEIRKINPSYTDIVDCCSIYRQLGKELYMIAGNRGNIKVTTPEDVYMYQALIRYRENEQTFGFGLTNRTSSRLAAFSNKDKTEENI